MGRSRLSREEREEMDEYLSKRERNKKIKRIGIRIGIVALLGLGIFLGYKMFHKEDDKPEITTLSIRERLEDASELTTKKQIISVTVHYSDGSIPFLTKKEYTMTCSGEVDAGVDLSKVKVDDLGDGKFDITLPDVEIYNIKVDPDTIVFYDESKAIFNWNTKDDGVEAIKLAETEIANSADIDNLKKEAEENAQVVINNLLQDAINDGKVTINN